MNKLFGLMALTLFAGNSFATKVLTFQEATDLVAVMKLNNSLTCDSAAIPAGASFVLESLVFTADPNSATIYGDGAGQYVEQAGAPAQSVAAYIDYSSDGASFTDKNGTTNTNQMVQMDAVGDVYQVVETTFYDGTVIDPAQFAQDATGKVTGVNFIEAVAGEGFVKIETTFDVSVADNSILKVNNVLSSFDLNAGNTISYTNLACQ